MKIPVLDEMVSDMTVRGDEMQETLNDIKALLVQIEINTRPVEEPNIQDYRFKG